MKPARFPRNIPALLHILALLTLFAGLAGDVRSQTSTPDLKWITRDGIQVFMIRFDHPPTIQATDQHVEMGYFYLDCFQEKGPAQQAEWPFKTPVITHVRRLYYAEQKVLRYIFYVPRGSNARIDKSMADPQTCVVTISPMVAAALGKIPAGGNNEPRKMVVIDPGHGGWPTDPDVSAGAQTSRRFGSRRYYEKDIALGIGKSLEEYIKRSPNIEASMTRREDVYVSLEDRIKIANATHGDLFISIHLNATDRYTRSPRGFEIFFLSNEDRAVNHQIAAMENEEKIHLDQKDSSGDTLRELLRILANEKFPQIQAESRDLCTVINEEFRKSGPFRGYNRGVKSAAFRVLLNFNMPAALAECGFLDNTDDARVLIQPSGQKQIAALLFNGINRYFAIVDPKFKPHVVTVDR